MATVVTSAAANGEQRVRLTGSVASVAACEVVTGRDEICIGSGPGNDLVMGDPLVPPRAFKLVRHKRHSDSTHEACQVGWILEAHPAARVFVNHRHTRRDRIVYGDTITVGCHQFSFTPTAPTARDRRLNVNVADLCAGLLRGYAIPPGFLSTCPSHRHRARLRQAFGAVGVLVAVLVLLVLLAPREKVFEPVQPALEVTLLAAPTSLPAAAAVRSLASVNRQTFTPPTPPTPTPDLVEPRPTPPPPLAAEPLTPRETPPTPAPPELARDRVSLPPLPLAPLPPTTPNTVLEVSREKVTLSGGAPLRRLSVAEAEAVRQAADLGSFQMKPDASSLSRATFQVTATAATTAGLQEPVRGGKLTGDQALRLAAALKPSPVNFEAYHGTFIPVARLAEQLAKVEDTATLSIDGVVTTAEASGSWKSGAFRVHAPGNPPPEAKPATYCYVSKTDVQGRQCLYISFVCTDPDVSKLIGQGATGAAAQLIKDDSVEIFLDTNFDRQDYCQMIVNCQGAYWTGYYKTADSRRDPQPWDAAPTIKTAINREANQWSCEILIPFDRLGGLPPAGARWAVNFCRNFRGQVEDWQLQSWFEVYDQNREFHHPSKFGVFQW